MTLIESYIKKDGLQDRYYMYELHFVQKEWEVWAWEVWLINPTNLDPSQQFKDIEHMWTAAGVTVGYKDGNPNRPIKELFTEETARKEFERWRS